MSDWPTQTVWPPPAGFISTIGPASGYWPLLLLGTTNPVGSAWPAANKAIYVSFIIQRPRTITKIAIHVTTQSGNVDVGIYDENRVRLVSVGSTAVGAAGLQVFDITDTALSPGCYYAAMCASSGTAAFRRIALGDIQTTRVCGVQEQAVGAVTLPDTATFANQAAVYVPVMWLGQGVLL